MRSQRRSARGTVGHAYSALNLRLVFATFGFVSCAILAVLTARAELVALTVVLVALAVIAAIDLIVIQRRRMARRREEPDTNHSLFE